MLGSVRLQSLEAYRPVGERAPDPQVAEVQRREFFAQVHRWSRQNHHVHLFCNNDGERQRFLEVWKDYGFDSEPGMTVELGSLSGGFLSIEARLVVVTDAEATTSCISSTGSGAISGSTQSQAREATSRWRRLPPR